MEEIEYKLKSNDNILISSAVSKLVSAIKKIIPNERIKDSVEFKLLQESCLSHNPLLSITSCHGMMILAQQGGLDFNYIVSTILSSALSSKFSSGIISALGQLLVMEMKIRIQNSPDQNYINPFNMNAPQHPFVIILMKKDCAWNDILNQIDLILNDDYLLSKHKIEFLKPVLLHILVNDSNAAENNNRLQLWKLLLREIENCDIQKFIIEVLMWNKIELDSNCLFASVLCIELLERALLLDISQLYMPIVPYLASILPSLLKSGADPKSSLVIISKVTQKEKLMVGADEICMILAECITICPSVYLQDLISLCGDIIHKHSVNLIAANTVVAAILQWMAYSSCLTASALKKAVELKQYIDNYHPSNIYNSTEYSLFKTTKNFSSTLLKYSEFSKISKEFNKDLSLLNTFLENLMKHDNSYFINEIRIYLLGIFICDYHSDIIIKVLKLLLITLKENCRFAVGLLTLILYKLTHESNVKVQLELLRALPQMAVVKENIPLIVHTISCLKKGPSSLQSLCIDLQMRLCNIDVRCYPYLQESLVGTYQDNSNRWYIDVINAISIRELCFKRPEHHGSELVAHISQLLNRCTDSRGEFPSSIALESITYLCNAGVVDVISTWRALSPRFNNECRPRVIISLCKFFGIIPSLSANTAEYQNLTEELIIKLWSYITDYNDKDIIESALEALSNYSIENIQFRDIPEIFKQNIKLPSNKISQEEHSEVEEIITYVPGECWIHLLQNINHLCLNKASELISKWMSSEISQYRSGIYVVPSGKGEPNNCSNLPAKSIVRAVIDFVLDSINTKVSKDLPILEHCLYILSKSYPKPLPPVNWCCLHDLYHQNERIGIFAVNIATNQMVISGSAKRFIENYLSDFDPENSKDEEILNLYKNLHHYCKLISPHNLKKVICSTLEFSLDKSLSSKENETGYDLFKQILEKVKFTLKAIDIQEENKLVIAQIVESLFDKIHQDDELFYYYAECCLELPYLYFDRITTPTMWWESSSSKLCKATIIRCAMSIKHSSEEKSLVWLNEIIDAGISEANDIQYYILNKIISVMQKRHDKKYTITNSEWCLELMGQTQAELVKLKEKTSKDFLCKTSIQFLCDVLILTLECLSGVLCLTSKRIEEVIKSSIKFDLFPISISILCTTAGWKDTMDQIIEWLYYMSSSEAIQPIYLATFQKALIVSKIHNTFEKKHLWSKIIQKTYVSAF